MWPADALEFSKLETRQAECLASVGITCQLGKTRIGIWVSCWHRQCCYDSLCGFMLAWLLFELAQAPVRAILICLRSFLIAVVGSLEKWCFYWLYHYPDSLLYFTRKKDSDEIAFNLTGATTRPGRHRAEPRPLRHATHWQS